ncbi:NAD-dependent succinate-semialdehyde dehydrogenase [Janthinobacterium aquaticum]|uniref:NAD-dependent succinate-semialdehyde dehydrogenase n=1 Tax=Janthinobacterium sp. FT58W TaxID=2654254 RepID=UPI001264FD58|nr:NAD-dependent succinate-semialdehyde dehydrogenase [Janthinobacterium sp. FT58W]KAB8041736.1 aldehyde dehydrogenase family protein [Janthinobacterium sp. FT58W]
MSYKTTNPYNEEVVKTFDAHSDAQLDKVLDTAHRLFQQDWRQRSFAERQTIVKKAAALLKEQRDDFARLITLEMGKLFKEAQQEVSLCVKILDYYADHAEQFLAPKKLDVKRGEASVEIAPLGVIFCVEPWNFPYYQLARVAGPNLMAGNTLVVKHASNVPQCALAFEKLFLDAGAPEGAYTNVFISSEQVATAIADPRVQGVALTGSERAGASVAASAGKSLKKTTMELGGSDAFIVLDDADMDLAVKLAVIGRIQNSGQVCDGSKRFILQESIADTFVERFQAELAKLVPGDPMQESTTLAPLSSLSALELAVKQVGQAVEGGARVLLGGKRAERKGYFMEPTILADVKPDNPVYYQEFFAPVAMIFRVKDENEAITLANDSPFGLGGTIITADVARGKKLASQIETGMVFINSPAVTAPDLPFGGVKNSGYGRELSDLGIMEFVNRKLVLVG